MNTHMSVETNKRDENYDDVVCVIPGCTIYSSLLVRVYVPECCVNDLESIVNSCELVSDSDVVCIYRLSAGILMSSIARNVRNLYDRLRSYNKSLPLPVREFLDMQFSRQRALRLVRVSGYTRVYFGNDLDPSKINGLEDIANKFWVVDTTQIRSSLPIVNKLREKLREKRFILAHLIKACGIDYQKYGLFIDYSDPDMMQCFGVDTFKDSEVIVKQYAGAITCFKNKCDKNNCHVHMRSLLSELEVESDILEDELDDLLDDLYDHTYKPQKRGSRFEYVLPRDSELSMKEMLYSRGFCVTEFYLPNQFDQEETAIIPLRGRIQLREYQERAVGVFSTPRKQIASGILVMPCGAGKTICGIHIAARVALSTIVLCTSISACKQWASEFLRVTELNSGDVCCFSSESDALNAQTCKVLVTTYAMMGVHFNTRSGGSAVVYNQISSRRWGLMILDEVHVTPAENIRKAIYNIRVCLRVGLTATLVREDSGIESLPYIVGPVLFEVKASQLVKDGFLSAVSYTEVFCELSPNAAELMYKSSNGFNESNVFTNRIRTFNPVKMVVCEQILIRSRVALRKTIIFCDDLELFSLLKRHLKVYCMSGATPSHEREEILNRFRLPFGDSRCIETILLSQVGDDSLDLPDASCIVQISSHFGSRMQELQRIGRIMRPKDRVAEFYTLLSVPSEDTRFNHKRRQYVMECGILPKHQDAREFFANKSEFDKSVNAIEIGINFKNLFNAKSLVRIRL